MSSSTAEFESVELPKDHEFRFEVPYGAIMNLKIISGTAEYFGTEIPQHVLYKFSGEKGCIYTWHLDCVIQYSGPCTYKIASDTSMVSYLDVHAMIQKKREEAAQGSKKGPKVILVGPTDVGKSSLTKCLVSWASREKHNVIYIDVDIGQGNITVPGMISALQITQPLPIGRTEIPFYTPLCYFYGGVTFSDNPLLYKNQMDNLSRDVDMRCTNSPEVSSAGFIVNTCGWIEGLGYQLIIDTIEKFHCDIILVLGNDPLYENLRSKYNKGDVTVCKVPKSSGVVVRNPDFRRKARFERFKEYFYGSLGELKPHSLTISFDDVVLLKPSLNQDSNTISLIQMRPTEELVNSVVGVSHTKEHENVMSSNLAGYLVIEKVNIAQKNITVLSPSSGPLPFKYILVGTLKWMNK